MVKAGVLRKVSGNPNNTVPDDRSGDDSQLDLARLLGTRVTHDLSGAIGALATGIELLDGEGASGLDADVMSLLRDSAQSGMARLKFMRAAFGVLGGNGSPQSAPSASAIRSAGVMASTITALMSDYARAAAPSVTVTYPSLPTSPLMPYGVSVVLLAFHVALDCLAGRGEVVVEWLPDDGGAVPSLKVLARGLRVALSPAARQALTGDTSGLTARDLPSYYLAATLGDRGGIELVEADDQIILTVFKRV